MPGQTNMTACLQPRQLQHAEPFCSRNRVDDGNGHCAGRVLEVLVEGVNPQDTEQAMGRIRQNKLCYFPGDGVALFGQLVNVEIREVRAYTLFGVIV